MLKQLLIATTIVLGLSSVSYAETKHKPVCTTLDKIQAHFEPNSYVITSLTNSQYHFLQGIYVLSPETPSGLPPGDSALLFTFDNNKSIGGIIVWINGTLGCDPLKITKNLIDLLKLIHESHDSL